jgi:hypothetical protein
MENVRSLRADAFSNHAYQSYSQTIYQQCERRADDEKKYSPGKRTVQGICEKRVERQKSQESLETATWHVDVQSEVIYMNNIADLIIMKSAEREYS